MDHSFWKDHPYVSVGIITGEEIRFRLLGEFIVNNQSIDVTGTQSVILQNNSIVWNGAVYSSLTFIPKDKNSLFCLTDVIIGIDYHWQRKEEQIFPGVLRFIVDGDKLTAINDVHIEEYLTSVISSEMNASASLEFLKASAVISRSWLLRQMENRKAALSSVVNTPPTGPCCPSTNTDEVITWSDRHDHTLFDVCADDHCQRYQGIQKATGESVKQAIHETWGTVLCYQEEICDARFSKSCGGISETYETCWDDHHVDYLTAVPDTMPDTSPIPDLTQEKEAHRWITSSPDSLCNTTDKEILSQVLNDYDQETTDFYRWTCTYTQEELRSLITHNSGIDFGDIIDLVPLQRGPSGRILRLKIIGSKRSLIIGKELEIRRMLSNSHLYSSAFIVDTSKESPVPQHFTLRGAGWGHGVGMCQIGAAVMGAHGFTHKDILLHYYKGATLNKIY